MGLITNLLRTNKPCGVIQTRHCNPAYYLPELPNCAYNSIHHISCTWLLLRRLSHLYKSLVSPTGCYWCQHDCVSNCLGFKMTVATRNKTFFCKYIFSFLSFAHAYLLVSFWKSRPTYKAYAKIWRQDQGSKCIQQSPTKTHPLVFGWPVACFESPSHTGAC